MSPLQWVLLQPANGSQCLSLSSQHWCVFSSAFTSITLSLLQPKYMLHENRSLICALCLDWCIQQGHNECYWSKEWASHFRQEANAQVQRWENISPKIPGQDKKHYGNRHFQMLSEHKKEGTLAYEAPTVCQALCKTSSTSSVWAHGHGIMIRSMTT